MGEEFNTGETLEAQGKIAGGERVVVLTKSEQDLDNVISDILVKMQNKIKW